MFSLKTGKHLPFENLYQRNSPNGKVHDLTPLTLIKGRKPSDGNRGLACEAARKGEAIGDGEANTRPRVSARFVTTTDERGRSSLPLSPECDRLT